MVKAGRLAVAACLLLGVLGIAVAHRYSPDTFGLTPVDRPVSDLVSSGKSEAAAGVQVLAEAINLGGQAQEGPRALAASGKTAGRGAGQPPHGMISLRLSATSAPVTIPKMGSGAIVVYTGAGPGNRFIVPESLYMDRATAMVMPLGYISPTRLDPEWMRIETGSMFFLPPVEAVPPRAPAADEAGVVKVRVLRPAEPIPERP